MTKLIDPNWANLLFTSFAQAFFSSSFSLALGAAGAFGLAQISEKYSLRRLAELFLLLPQLLPSLFVLLATYNLYAIFDEAPNGFTSVVIVHTFINAGFCAVILSRLFSDRAGGYSELARVEGAGFFQFAPTLLRLVFRDLLFVFFTVFIFCFTSFSVPFVIGGFASATLEVEIYKKIVSEGAFGQALLLSLFQVLFLMIVGVFLYGRGHSLTEKNKRPFTYGHALAIFPLLVLNAGIVIASLKGIGGGLQELLSQPILQSIAVTATVGTVLTSTVAALVSLALFALLAYRWPNEKASGVLFGFTSPSPILFGFFLFIMGLHQVFGPEGYLYLGTLLAFFFCPLVFRFGLASAFSRYRRHVEVARAMGASRSLIFTEVTWPQLSKSMFFFAGIVAFWAAGDFALSLFILPGEAHLPLLIRGLILRYRLESATLLMWWMVLIGLFQLLVFQGLGYVTHRKLK